MVMNEKIVTARDYTIIELKQKTRKATRQAFVWGLVSGIALSAIGYWLWQNVS